MLEGMAAGTAVVASDIPGYANVARPDRDAFLVPPGDPGALASALREALIGGPEVKAMRESAYERACQHSMDALARRYLYLYATLLGD